MLRQTRLLKSTKFRKYFSRVLHTFVFTFSLITFAEASNKPAQKAVQETDKLSPTTHYDSLFNLSLEDLLNLKVQSISNLETSLREAPAYTKIFYLEELDKSPARNLSDILEMHMPGNYLGMHARHGTLHGVRGILIDNNAKTTVTLDLQNINQNMHFGYATGMMSPLMGDISRIEVTNGPGSITQGSGVINGFINLVPKNGSDYAQPFFNIEHGFKETSTFLEAGRGFSYGYKQDLFVYAGVYNAQGFEPKETYGQTTTGGINAYGFEDLNYRFSTYWRHKKFSLNSFYFENNPHSGNADQPNREGWAHQATAGLRPKYELSLSTDQTLKFSGSFFAADYAFNYKDKRPTAGGSEQRAGYSCVYTNSTLENSILAIALSYNYKNFDEKNSFSVQTLQLPMKP